MHQGLAGHRDIQGAVAVGGDLAETRTHHQQQVGILHRLDQLRPGGEAQVPRVIGVGVVEQVLATEGCRHRQVVALGEAADVRDRAGVPAATAEDHKGALGAAKQPAQRLHVGSAGVGFDEAYGACVGDVHDFRQHVLGQGDHYRTGTAIEGAVEGLAQ
ncbi:hypothetical protein D3C84_338130 [compost metagenome]